MSENTENLDPRLIDAINEMKKLISGKYPGTTYSVEPGNEPGSVFVYADVDVEEPDYVVDLFVDRLVTIQVDEGIPLYVIPRRTPARLEAYRASVENQRRRIAL